MSDKDKSDVQQLRGILDQFSEQTVEAVLGVHSKTCHSSPGVVTAVELMAPSIRIDRDSPSQATTDDRIGTTRGQNVKKCPTDALLLHANLTAAAVNVSGDLKIDAKSCPVTFVYGPASSFTFKPGTDLGVTVPLAPGVVLTGSCDDSEEEEKLCKWSFRRTSP